MDFTGKVIVVTGASRKIGAAVAEAFGGHGGSVIVNYFTGKEGAERVVASIEAAGGRAIAYGADVRDREQVRGMVQQAVKTFGGLDILVNNARLMHPKKPFLEVEWQTDMCGQMDVHLGGAFHCCQEAIPQMIARGGGAIVNMLSTAYKSANLRLHAYGPAKAALRNFTMSLAAEFGPKGIRVNSVSPGSTVSAEYPSRTTSESEMEQRRQRTPLQRIGAPDDIAWATAFLCSGEARHITGADLPVNGGASMTL